MFESTKHELLKNGDKAVIIPIERLQDLKNDVEDLRNSEYFNKVTNIIINDFYRFDLPDVHFMIRSIIVVARPRSLVKVNFSWKAKNISVLHEADINGVDKTAHIEQYLNEFLNPKGYHVKSVASLPQKLLAVRSGLAKYGRNNIAYVDDMGSLHELITYYSDMPSTENNWFEVRQMDFCKACMACLNNCPTAAITKDRYLIKTERCLTYLNEFIGPGDFPSWLDLSAHNCIHGCLECQICCPENRGFQNNVAGLVEFSEDETLLLLKGKSVDELPADLEFKIKKLNLTDYLDLLPRNLNVLFK